MRLLLLLLLLRIPVLPGCQVGLHVHGCNDVGLEIGRHITLTRHQISNLLLDFFGEDVDSG